MLMRHIKYAFLILVIVGITSTKAHQVKEVNIYDENCNIFCLRLSYVWYNLMDGEYPVLAPDGITYASKHTFSKRWLIGYNIACILSETKSGQAELFELLQESDLDTKRFSIEMLSISRENKNIILLRDLLKTTQDAEVIKAILTGMSRLGVDIDMNCTSKEKADLINDVAKLRQHALALPLEDLSSMSFVERTQKEFDMLFDSACASDDWRKIQDWFFAMNAYFDGKLFDDMVPMLIDAATRLDFNMGKYAKDMYGMLIQKMSLLVGPLSLPDSKETVEYYERHRNQLLQWWKINKNVPSSIWLLNHLAERNYSTSDPQNAPLTMLGLIDALENGNEMESYAAARAMSRLRPESPEIVVSKPKRYEGNSQNNYAGISKFLKVAALSQAYCRYFAESDHYIWYSQDGVYRINERKAAHK